MSNSFYGGKKGFSFTLQPNSLINSNGLFGSLGTSADSAEADSLYGGIKRGDIQPGEYAIVSGGSNAGEIYRASFSTPSNLILCAKIPTLKGEPGDPGPQGQPGADGKDGKDGKDGRAAHWFQGSSAPSGTYEDVHSGDMYLNTTIGDVYRYDEDGNWVYEQNIRGPAEGESEIAIQFTDSESSPTNCFYLKPPLGICAKDIKSLPVSGTVTIPLTGSGVSPFDTAYGDKIAYYDIPSIAYTEEGSHSIYIYEGGVLPPAVFVPKNTIATFGVNGQNLINWSNSISLHSGYLYIILHSGILPIQIDTNYNLYGFRAFLNAGGGRTLEYCSLNVIKKISANSGSWTDHTSWKLNSKSMIATGGNNTVFYGKDGTEKKLLPFGTTIPYGYTNSWEAITDIMSNAQKALMIRGGGG